MNITDKEQDLIDEPVEFGTLKSIKSGVASVNKEYMFVPEARWEETMKKLREQRKIIKKALKRVEKFEDRISNIERGLSLEETREERSTRFDPEEYQEKTDNLIEKIGALEDSVKYAKRKIRKIYRSAYKIKGSEIFTGDYHIRITAGNFVPGNKFTLFDFNPADTPKKKDIGETTKTDAVLDLAM
ncbi:hypothetical protein ACFLQ8_03420 [Candidatus Auribacterota bacterium]